LQGVDSGGPATDAYGNSFRTNGNSQRSIPRRRRQKWCRNSQRLAGLPFVPDHQCSVKKHDIRFRAGCRIGNDHIRAGSDNQAVSMSAKQHPAVFAGRDLALAGDHVALPQHLFLRRARDDLSDVATATHDPPGTRFLRRTRGRVTANQIKYCFNRRQWIRRNENGNKAKG
jgi:hypothetical protein